MQHFTTIWKDILKALSFNADIIASDRELVIVFTEHVYWNHLLEPMIVWRNQIFSL